MAKEEKTFYKCDINGEVAEYNSGGLPPGWVELCFDNPHLDRDWYYKHVCPKCIKKIEIQADDDDSHINKGKGGG